MKWNILFIMIMLLQASCGKDVCLGKAGTVVKTTRGLPSFQQLNIADNINVILLQDSTEHITIEAPESLAPSVVARVEGSVLTISNDAPCTALRRASEKINVYLHFKMIDRLDYKGSGNITSSGTLHFQNITLYSETGAGNINLDVEAQHLFCYIMGENADITLRGKTARCNNYTASRGSIDISGLETGFMIMEYGSVRDCLVDVRDSLSNTIYHTGNVYYKGNPKIILDRRHSSGRLIPY